MGFFKKFINKIKNFIRSFIDKKQINEKKIDLLEAPSDNQFEIGIDKEINKFNLIETEQNENENYIEEKSEFFRIYNLYKQGKINPQNLLITDLIRIQQMLLEEQMTQNKIIEERRKEVLEQEQYVKQLEIEQRNLEKKLAVATN